MHYWETSNSSLIEDDYMETFHRGKTGDMPPVTVCLNCVHSPSPTMNWGARQDENLPVAPADYQFGSAMQSIGADLGQKITAFPITLGINPLTSLRTVPDIMPSESFLKSKNISETTPPEEPQKIENILIGFDGPADLYLTKKEIIQNQWELTPITADSKDSVGVSKILKRTYRNHNSYTAFASPAITSRVSAAGGVFHRRDSLSGMDYPFYWTDKSLGYVGESPKGFFVAKKLGIDKIWGERIGLLGLQELQRYSRGVGLQRLLNDVGSISAAQESGGWSSALFVMLLRNDLARTADTDYYSSRGYLNSSMTTQEIIQSWLDKLNRPEDQMLYNNVSNTLLKTAVYHAYRMFSELLMMQKTIDDLTLFCKLGILGNGGFLSTLIIPERKNIPGYELDVREADRWGELREFVRQYVESVEQELALPITEKGEPFFRPLYKMDCNDLDYEKLLESLQIFEKAYYTFMLKGLNWQPLKLKIPDRADEGKSINMDVFKILHSPFILSNSEWTGSVIAQHPAHNIYVSVPPGGSTQGYDDSEKALYK
jgi:hypothetical protein